MFDIHMHQVRDAGTHSRQIRDRMNSGDSGLRQLGSGCFGTAYEYKEGAKRQIIKVTHGNDWGYLAYLERIQKISGRNPWVPNIYMVEFYMDRDGDSCYVVRMEQMESMQRQAQSSIWTTKQEQIRDYIMGRDYEKWITEDRQLMQVVDLVREAKHRSKCSYDLHHGNMMVRAKKQLVITDPLGYPT